MAGRPSKELEAAISWLKIKLTQGAIQAGAVEKYAPCCMQTMRKAKKKLGLMTRQYSTGWFWVYPSTVFDSVSSQPPITIPESEPEPEEEDREYRANTEEIMLGVNGQVLMGKNEPEIIQEMVLSCAQYPMKKPYSRRYIESVVKHCLYGTDIRTDLNENKD